MIPVVTVRPITPADIHILARWICAAPLWQRYGVIETTILVRLEHGLQKADTLLVSDVDQMKGRACGLAWCIPYGAFGRSTYLRMLGVRENYIGLGIGATLLKQVEQTTTQYTNEIFLLVSDFNTDAQRFYQRHGYSQVGSIPGYVVPNITELVYWKRL